MGVHLGRNILQTTRSNSGNHAIIRPRIAFSRFAEGQGLNPFNESQGVGGDYALYMIP
jgi:hypothetical protein